MNASDNTSPTSDEKLMGALAHLFGPLAAIIVWAIQKDKSRFAKFQALQALAFDLFVSIGMGLLFFCVFGVGFLIMSGVMLNSINSPSSSDGLTPFFLMPMIFPFMTFGCILPLSFVLILVRLAASISILNGRNYHYPIIGKWLDDFLEK